MSDLDILVREFKAHGFFMPEHENWNNRRLNKKLGQGHQKEQKSSFAFLMNRSEQERYEKTCKELGIVRG